MPSRVVTFSQPFFIAVCLFGLTCSDLTKPIEPEPGTTQNKNFRIMSPIPGSIHKNDSILTIVWESVSASDNEPVAIILYKGDSLIDRMSTISNTDTTLAIRFYPLASGSNYRIKVVSTRDTSKYDFGGYFTIRPGYTGTISIVEPKAGSVVHPETALTVMWTTTDTIGPSVVIQLYCDSTPPLVRLPESKNSGRFITTIPSTINAGDKYRFKISSYYDPAISAFSDYFSIHFSGGLTITKPEKGILWVAGSSDSIEWASTGSPGSDVMIDLFRDDMKVLTVIPRTSRSNSSYVWSIPYGTATSDRYRIQIKSVNDTLISSFSEYFIIAGTPSDSFEYDDSSVGASAILINGTIQNRTLTKDDIDWIWFTTIKDSVYIIIINGGIAPHSSLYTNPDSIYVCSRWGSASSSYVWKATANGKTFIKVTPSDVLPGSFGDYSVSVKQTSESGIVAFRSPNAASNWVSDSTYFIHWVPDTVLFGKFVEMGLFKGDHLIESTTRRNRNNMAGTDSITLPAGIASGSDYRIWMSNDGSSERNTAYSEFFTISGMAADTFETDNMVSQARTIVADGTEQVHTLTWQDTDWIRFATEPSLIYKINVSCATPLKSAVAQVYNNSLNQLSEATATDSTTATFIHYSQSGGSFHVSIQYPHNYGMYRVSVTTLDTSFFNVRVHLPAAGSTYKIGRTCSIAWTSPPSLADVVDITLFNKNGEVQTIFGQGYPLNGSYDWIMPSTLVAGTSYYIKIIARTTQITGVSGIFTITN